MGVQLQEVNLGARGDSDDDNDDNNDGSHAAASSPHANEHIHDPESIHRKRVGPKLTAFLLLNAMIGAGILNVPYTFQQSGVVLGVCIFLFFGLLTWISLIALIHTGIVTNTWDYGELAQKACGKKGEVQYYIVQPQCSVVPVTEGSVVSFQIFVH